jgi:hypothetical protein
MVVASLENVVSVCLSFCLSLRIRTHQLDEQSLLCIHKRDQCTPRPSFGCLLAVRAKRTQRSQQRQRDGKWSISLWRSADRDSNSFHNQWRDSGQYTHNRRCSESIDRPSRAYRRWPREGTKGQEGIKEIETYSRAGQAQLGDTTRDSN